MPRVENLDEKGVQGKDKQELGQDAADAAAADVDAPDDALGQSDALSSLQKAQRRETEHSFAMQYKQQLVYLDFLLTVECVGPYSYDIVCTIQAI